MIVDLNYCYRVAKNIIILILSILGVFIGFKFAIFYMPFLVAFIISIMIEPIIKFIMKKTKLKRRTSSIIVFIVALGIIIGIITLVVTSLITETSEIMTNFNEYAETAYNMLQNFMQDFDFKKLKIPENVIQTVQNSMNELLQTATVWTKGALSGVINFITSIPTIGICTMVTLLALYFICVDKIYMIDQIEHHLPETWVKKIGVHLRDLIKTLGGYLKAEVILIVISFIISLIGLYIFHFMGLNVEYPFLIALLIGFVDALPIFGSGTVMIPWAVFTAFMGDLKLALAIFILWAIMSIVRQFIEPRIVSGHIGIHPIFTLIAMYTGFKIIGVIGMFVGPIVLIILKNIYQTLIDKGVVKSIFER